MNLLYSSLLGKNYGGVAQWLEQSAHNRLVAGSSPAAPTNWLTWYNIYVIEKIKTVIKHPTVRQLQDVRLLGFIVFGVVALLVTWNGIGVIETNYKLQKQVSQLEQENSTQELANDNLKLQNQYYKTDEYLELAARRQFGKAEPGETVLIVPKSVAMAHIPKQPPKESTKKTPALEKPFYQRNFEAWMDFFFHRQ